MLTHVELDLREADFGRPVSFDGGALDGEAGWTVDYLSWTEDGDLIDHLPEVARDYVDTSVGPRLRYVLKRIVLRRFA